MDSLAAHLFGVVCIGIFFCVAASIPQKRLESLEVLLLVFFQSVGGDGGALDLIVEELQSN